MAKEDCLHASYGVGFVPLLPQINTYSAYIAPRPSLSLLFLSLSLSLFLSLSRSRSLILSSESGGMVLPMLGPRAQRQRYTTAFCAYRPTFICCWSKTHPPPPPPPLPPPLPLPSTTHSIENTFYREHIL